jgi:hypothetical protein
MARDNLLKISWLFACICVLAWWHFSYELKSDLSEILKAESEIYLIIGMVILTFPVGLIWTYLLGVIFYVMSIIHINVPTSVGLNILILWVGFVLFGYLQWFKLVPWWIGRRRSRRR